MMEEHIRKLYTDVTSPYAFGGVDRLQMGLKRQGHNISKNKIRKILQSVNAYTLHKPARKRYLRRPIMVSRPGLFMNADLAEFGDLSKKNKGYKYWLICQDMFSRYVYGNLLKNKTAASVAKATDKILKKTLHNYRFFQTDSGGEFHGAKFKKLMEKYNIKHYSTYNRETKASLSERVIKTLKHVLYKTITHRNKVGFLDTHKNIIEAYNNRPHSGLGFKTPSEVHAMTDEFEIKKMAETILAIKLKKFVKKSKRTGRKTINKGVPLKIGSYVRLVKANVTQDPFQKGFKQQQTHEIFQIKSINWDTLPYTYKLIDLASENIKGSFYKHELVETAKPEFFLIDRVIKSKVKNKKKFYYVAWLGYDKSFNSWVDSEAIYSLKKKK